VRYLTAILAVVLLAGCPAACVDAGGPTYRPTAPGGSEARHVREWFRVFVAAHSGGDAAASGPLQPLQPPTPPSAATQPADAPTGILAAPGASAGGPVVVEYERVESSAQADQPQSPGGPASAQAGAASATSPPSQTPPSAPVPPLAAMQVGPLTAAGLACLGLALAVAVARFLPWTAPVARLVPWSVVGLALAAGIGLIALPSILAAVPWWAWATLVAVVVVAGVLPGALANLRDARRPAAKPLPSSSTGGAA